MRLARIRVLQIIYDPSEFLLNPNPSGLKWDHVAVPLLICPISLAHPGNPILKGLGVLVGVTCFIILAKLKSWGGFQGNVDFYTCAANLVHRRVGHCSTLRPRVPGRVVSTPAPPLLGLSQAMHAS